ncbi:MAG: hypothetical protein OHK0039_24120 [Bacteroidia bacterium]
MKVFGLRLLVFILLCSTLTGLLAQVYNVTRYSTEHGLVQSQVMCLLQDSRGYLWLGTHRGVSIYDGSTFQDYGKEDGLPGTFLSDLLEDRQGAIWIASDGGLTRFFNNHFTNFTTQTSPALPEDNIVCLMEDQEGGIWIGTQDKGIFRYRNDTIEAVRLASDLKNVQVMLQDRGGRVWIGTRSGLFMSAGGAQAQMVRGLPGGLEVFSLLEDRTGAIWVSARQGLWRGQAGSFEAMRLPGSGEGQIVDCMVEDRQGQVWLGTGNGVLRYHDGQIDALPRKDRLLAYQMRSAVVDDEGNIWFGTDGGGVRKITEGVFERYGIEENFSSNLAKSFLEDRQGRIWTSTRDRGINVFGGDRVQQTYTVSDGLGGDDICSSFADRDGRFWFASYNGTLTRYDGRSFRVFDRDDSLSCNAVYWMCEGPDRNLWIATDNGVFVLDNEYFIYHYTRSGGLPSNTVYSLLTDARGRLWAGTSEGIGRWEQGQFRPVGPARSVGTNVITLLEDPVGRVWVGSSVGLTCFVGDTAHRIPVSEAKGAHTVVALVVEADRYLWIGTENGVYRLDLSTFDPAAAKHSFEHYTQKDGLPSLECNANAAFIDSRGDLWIGTAEGAIHKPAGTERRESSSRPHIYITSVHTSGGAPEAHLEYPLDSLADRLILPYTDNRIIFDYSGISLTSSQQLEYQFKLEGEDKAWQSPTRTTQAYYLNIDPGTYTFKVTVRKESEPWDYTYYAAFVFEIRPPFWTTWWFISLLMLLLAGIGYAIYLVIYTRRERIREERRMRNTAEKLQLEHQALYAMMNPHFTFNALQSIQYFIHRQDKLAANKFLTSFAKLVRKNLESTKVDVISLGEELERLHLYLSLEKMRFPEKFDYRIEVDPDIDQSETQLPPMLLQPFVENSIKHGIMSLEQNGLIEILVEAEGEDYLRIIIRDNGIGIEASKQRKIDRPSDHVSKGMQITRDRLTLFARMTGKQYQVDIRERTQPDGSVQGTEVLILMPVRQEETLMRTEA